MDVALHAYLVVRHRKMVVKTVLLCAVGYNGTALYPPTSAEMFFCDVMMVLLLLTILQPTALPSPAPFNQFDVGHNHPIRAPRHSL
jgi:uncharacterized membrane protein